MIVMSFDTMMSQLINYADHPAYILTTKIGQDKGVMKRFGCFWLTRIVVWIRGGGSCDPQCVTQRINNLVLDVAKHTKFGSYDREQLHTLCEKLRNLERRFIIMMRPRAMLNTLDISIYALDMYLKNEDETLV